MEAFGVIGMSMGSVGFVFGLIAFTLVQAAGEKVTGLAADLQSLKKEVAKLRRQLGQGGATS